EAALVLFLIGLMMTVAIPALVAALSRSRVVAAGRELEQEMARLRSVAIASGGSVAMRLAWSAGRYGYSFFRDGDGDAIRAEAIAISGAGSARAAPRRKPEDPRRPADRKGPAEWRGAPRSGGAGDPGGR